MFDDNLTDFRAEPMPAAVRKAKGASHAPSA